jgi:SpoIVB peptidase S55
MSAVTPLRISDVADRCRTSVIEVRLLSLLDCWFACRAIHSRGAFWLRSAADGIISGMSGSPILAGDGSVIGVVTVVNGDPDKAVHSEGGPQPGLTYHLPARFLAVN